MHIKQVLEMDDGIGPITCAGTVEYVTEQSEGEGKKGKWTRQFVVIKEGDSDIGVTLWNARYINKSERIIVCGKTQEYEGKITLSAKLQEAGQSKQQEGSQQSGGSSQEKKDVDWDAKERREHRGHGIHNATLLVVALAEVNQESRGMSPELVVEMAETYMNYVYNGKESVPEPSNEGRGGGEPPVGDDDIPF